ncbi:oxygen-regulated protein 1 [Chaetodon trifascialis]|uniref:oxygen-regulated protein 1 n=1 Tax=Chaetodon trifascialis TaxID=109706 RepID=UPI0039931823
MPSPHNMSNTPVQDPPVQELSSGSGQTLPSRPFQPNVDPSLSKRVCFYKSGDYKFSGHRMVINARTFKTFDALLDALSKKVPLPFGVRTITTPRGTHVVRALDDLHDGGSYVCSDQKRVKPLNLDEVNRRQVPWNTTRPFSAGRRKRQRLQFGQFGRRNEVANRPAKVTERVAVRTPKKLEVIKNRDPTVKRTIVLQRRTAPTFDALLDYLSQILQFPVLKLFSTDGRRVDGLAALILCSGVVVAAGNEPFKLGNYSLHRTGQMAQAMYMDTVEPAMLQPRAQNNKSISSGRGSRNFSLSSERYIVEQVNKSRNGSLNGQLHRRNQSFETEVNHRRSSVETCGTGRISNEHRAFIVPQEDDIEKSFRVNQDGSMTVEMKVHLTIKEEELLHWTTTLSRSSLSKRTACASVSESGNSSPDSNNAVAKDSSSISEDETKEENHPMGAGKGVGFNDERVHESSTSTASAKVKTGFKRTPTPGPRHVHKKSSVESVKTLTETGVQESTLGHYSYMERTADGETTEGYCIVRHSSSSNRPIPKPRKTASAGANKNGSHSSIRSSGVAEVLQIQNNGMEVTETVMHIYESQGCYDNYFANEEYSVDGVPLHGSTPAPESKPSTVSGPCSSSNDCDIDFSTPHSLQRQKEEMLSLSSEPVTPTHEITSKSVTESETRTATNSQTQGTLKKDKAPKSEKKKITNPARSQKNSTSTSSSDKKQKESINPSKHSKHSSTEKLSSNASVGKKSLSSSESAKSGQKSRGAEKPQIKKVGKEEKMARKEQALLSNTENVRRTPPQRQTVNKAAAKDNGHNVNTPTGRPQMKKNMSDILQPKKSLLPGKKTVSKPKSMIENRASSPKKSSELSESFSMPSLNPSPSEIHQYVESWLEKVSADPVPYTEEAITDESEPQTKVLFQIGGESESDEKSECQTNLGECYPSPGDAVKKSPSCLSVPLCNPEPATALLHNEQYMRGLCVSMPSVRVDPVQQENRLRAHRSAEAIGPADNESSSTTNLLSPEAKLKPALRQLCSSIQCIRRVPDTNTMSNLEKSNSLPDFPTQVASVFGSSCKAFLSFLSVMTLRDVLTGSVQGDVSQSRCSSEAMLMMESLQKISAIDDEQEQRASLTDLQSRASSNLRERWKDFQILRERLESEPLSPKFSETEFALDVVSEGGDVFEDQHLVIDELMEELNMPQDLRAQISSTIQQAKGFYPVEESTFVETERPSDSEEDVEKFVEESDNETKQSPESDTIAEDITQTKQGADDNEQTKMMMESEQEPDRVQETGSDVQEERSRTERDEPLKDNENEDKEQVEEDREEANDREGGDTKELDDDDDGQETETGEREREEEAEEREVTEEKMDDNGQEEREAEEVKDDEEKTVEKAEEGTEEEMTLYGEEEGEELNMGGKEVIEETAEGLMDEEDQEARENDAAETDEREGVEEAEEEEEGLDEIDEEPDDEEKGEEGGAAMKKGGDFEEETDEVTGETDEGEEVGNNVDEVQEEEEEEEEEADTFSVSVEEETQEGVEEMMEVIEEKDEEEEVENQIEEMEEEEETDVVTEKDVENEVTEEEEEGQEGEGADVVTEKDGEDEVTEEEEEEEAEEEEGADVVTEKDGEDEVTEEEEEGEGADVVTEKDGEDEVTEEEEEEEAEEEEGADVVTKKDVENEVTEVEEDEEEEMKEVINEDDGEDVVNEKDEEEEKTEVVSEENSEEDEKKDEEEQDREQEEKEEKDVEVKNKEERVITDEEEEEEEETDKNIEEQEHAEGEESRKELEKTEDSLEEESLEEEEVVEEEEEEEGMKAEQIRNEEERDDDDEENKSNEFSEAEEQESKDGSEEEHVPDDADSVADTDCKMLLEEASYLQQQSSCEEETNADTNAAQHDNESPTKYSSEGQCEADKGTGSDSVNELETGEGGGRSSSLPHPVEISQELLDFVNSALQSSSLIFTYDAQGNIRIEPDSARVVQNNLTFIPKSKEDSSYGLKCLPSPSTSDLSDYRPETSESGGYQSQDSVDIVTESGEEASEKPCPVRRHVTDIPDGRTNMERANSKLSAASNPEALQNSRLKSGGSFSSFDTGTKASREDLSYFSAGSSQKADAEAAKEDTQCICFASEKDSADGVLIDRGRWLLKENHLIRKSPPVSLGMYGNADSTSLDTGQENTSEDSLSPHKTKHNPLAAISSSELEEMAKPPTPKCTYYNMPHGSDSDPFLDDSSFKSGKRDTSSVNGRGFRVSPTIDTSKTWASKNGSLSSFASVEFKIPDRKVHPEGEPSAVTRPRRTSSGGGSVLQAQDSLDTLHVRCGQYCPIL